MQCRADELLGINYNATMEMEHRLCCRISSSRFQRIQCVAVQRPSLKRGKVPVECAECTSLVWTLWRRKVRVSGGCFWFWSSMWVDEEGQVYPHRQGRPWPAAEPHTLDSWCWPEPCPPPMGHPPLTHRHTHQETEYSLLHIFTQEPQTPEKEKATQDGKKSHFLKGLFHLCGE